jgi:hypothetical protein
MHRLFPSFQSIRSSQKTRRLLARSTLGLAAGVVCLLGALALVGCGVTVNIGGDSDGSQQGSTPSVKSGGTTSVKPCPGAAVSPGRSPTIVLTVKDSYKTTQAHVGDVIEVQLDAKTHWSSPAHDITAVLAALQPQGGMDEQSQTCRWFYEAMATGTATLNFTGAPLCDPGAPCPAIARAEQFTIQVS